MKHFCLLVFFSVIGISTFAQRVAEGERLIQAKEFAKAYKIYETALKSRPSDPKTNFLFALCCYELKKDEQAIVHFEQAGAKFPIRSMYLGELYFRTYRFDLAVSAYQTYLASIPPEEPKSKDIQKKIEKAEMANRLLKRVEDIAILDSILVDKTNFLSNYKFASDLGALSMESIALADSSIVDKVRYTTERQDRVLFSDTVQGQMDLFTSFKLFDNWAKPTPLSTEINSIGNENYPFLLLDGITLYFASDNEKSLGGYDLFVTQYNPNSQSYLAPENIGFPFNSTANDYMMVIDEQRKIGWFATDRNQESDKVMIYIFVTSDPKSYIRTDDNNLLRTAATLKSYRIQKANTTDEIQKNSSGRIAMNSEFRFIINDSTVYTKLDEFKSKVAKSQLSQWNSIYYESKNIEFHLEELRTQYHDATVGEEQTKLGTRILTMENKRNELEKILASKYIELCNEEVKFLQNPSKQKK